MPHHSVPLAPQLHPSVFVAVGAVVVGDVQVGEDASIWFNAVVRGDTEPIRIGQRTNIQDGAVLHADPGFPCVLADGVTVGHRAIVHGATVEPNVVVGMGAIVLNGARIGENSIIGAGAVVTEGAIIPPGSLALGVPAKVVRQLSEEEIERGRRSAEHYVRLAQKYRDESTGEEPRPS